MCFKICGTSDLALRVDVTHCNGEQLCLQEICNRHLDRTSSVDSNIRNVHRLSLELYSVVACYYMREIGTAVSSQPVRLTLVAVELLINSCHLVWTSCQ